MTALPDPRYPEHCPECEKCGEPEHCNEDACLLGESGCFCACDGCTTPRCTETSEHRVCRRHE